MLFRVLLRQQGNHIRQRENLFHQREEFCFSHLLCGRGQTFNRSAFDTQPDFANAVGRAEDTPVLGYLLLAVLSVFQVLCSVAYLHFNNSFMYIDSLYMLFLMLALFRLAYSACCRR